MGANVRILRIRFRLPGPHGAGWPWSPPAGYRRGRRKVYREQIYRTENGRLRLTIWLAVESVNNGHDTYDQE